eukprot:SAG31_NODE_2525_length_5562_cov_2.144243_3_plen_57_part_00
MIRGMRTAEVARYDYLWISRVHDCAVRVAKCANRTIAITDVDIAALTSLLPSEYDG